MRYVFELCRVANRVPDVGARVYVHLLDLYRLYRSLNNSNKLTQMSSHWHSGPDQSRSSEHPER